jgi:ribosomal-protein-alanine N-acetyltransferase
LIKPHCRAEIGYSIHPDYWGQGIMTETFKILIEFGFSELKLHSIEANVNPKNVQSIKLLEKIGFKKEAHFRENFLYNGEFLDSLIYCLLESDARNYSQKK